MTFSGSRSGIGFALTRYAKPNVNSRCKSEILSEGKDGDHSFLLIAAAMKERNHVDESVCHLQDSSFQISRGREGAVPVWVGMGCLETKSGTAANFCIFDRFPVEDRNLRKQKVLGNQR